MKKIHYMDEWELDKNFPNDKRYVVVRILIAHLDYKSVLNNTPAERKKLQIKTIKTNFKKLIDKKLFDNYELIGTLRRPLGVKAKIPYTSLKKLDKFDFVFNAFVYNIDNAKKIKPKAEQSYFCIKMTVTADIEGQTKGNQTVEKRFVLIKARSEEAAYKKLEKTKDKYFTPHLNYYGQLVRWKIESFDDCYDTMVTKLEDYNDPEGIEIYSESGSRRLTKDRIWDGKIE